MFKRVMCSADVVAAAECQTTFDITGHRWYPCPRFSPRLRTDWAYGRYYEGKQSLGQLYNGLRNLNVCFVNYLHENKPGERAAFEASGSSTSKAGVRRPTPDPFAQQGARLVPEHHRENHRGSRRASAPDQVLYATMRHILRDIRVGAPDDGR